MEENHVVNSTSLEDVVLNEISDNRAQSIQSLHNMVDIPAIDSTLSYDDLQQRLESSNLNILNMQQQQQKLLHLQNIAKKHLIEMEQLRQRKCYLSFGQGEFNGGELNVNNEPEYESIEQVHSDMAALVGRMKNLTIFIQNQNQLSNILGDDGPETLAEQEELQCKLESLRIQRDEMRSLVHELQDINRPAEKSINESRQNKQKTVTKTIVGDQPNSERKVSIENALIVPVQVIEMEMSAGHKENINAEENDDGGARKLIQHKVTGIEAMKTQLKHLKNVMDTVNIIKQRKARDPRDVGSIFPRHINSQSSDVSPYESEQSSIADSSFKIFDEENIAFKNRKVRRLDEVTSDLRAQAESLFERDRIKSLHAEIVPRKEKAAITAQMGENVLKCQSLNSPPNIFHNHDEPDVEHDNIELEYKIKKEEIICQSSQSEDDGNPAMTTFGASIQKDTVTYDEVQCAKKELNDSELPNEAGIIASASDHLNCGHKSLNLTEMSLNDVAKGQCITDSANNKYGAGSISPPLAPSWNGNRRYNVQPLQQVGSSVVGENAVPVASPSANGAANFIYDPVLLQQFVQTQQTLINSVCQCNQMLWHQQREIDSLNNTIHLLQDRLVSLIGPSDTDISFKMCAESVPPFVLYGTLPNRAQSEQPTTPQNMDFRNYQMQQYHQQQVLQRDVIPEDVELNYRIEAQQQNAATKANANIASTLNDVALQPKYNNAIAQSPLSGAGPVPIYVRHHNIATLFTQNHQLNNLQQQQPNNMYKSNSFNNQVPPPNSGFNYCNNFRR